MTQTLPYGNWPSSISADLLTAQNIRLSEIKTCAQDIFWLESRPLEKGRNALVQYQKNGTHRDILPEPHSIRTRAHEYGGSSYTVTDTSIFCVLDTDQRIYQFNRNTQELTALSSEGDYRYADFCWDNSRQRLICIREDHTNANHNTQQKIEERSEIISIDLQGKVSILVSGADFYSNPRLNPIEDKLSYLCWNHPQMPWDGSECYCAALDATGNIIHTQHIAGSVTESIFQPQWSPNGELFFVSDRTNWWNIYRYCHNNKRIEIICDMPAEFATPQWVFGMSTYGFLSNTDIFCCYSQEGQWHLGVIDIPQKTLHTIHTDFRDISGIYAYQEQAYFLASSATHSNGIFQYTNQKITSILPAQTHPLNLDDISQPQPMCFSTSDNAHAYGFYYAPKNSNVIAPSNTLPPLIVMCHGGPTGATETSLNSKIQFWTSRGFAVLDVNYRGSTGYGRQYRDALKHNWGIIDVIDVCSGATFLIEKGFVDAKKIAIRGSSAGGFTVLAALTFSDTFTAGASLYGIGDLEALACDTHKFEARYLDSLIGEYPDERDIYIARSPIHHIEQLNCPVIFLQGLKDKVVPPNQAEAMVAALTKKGIKNTYLTFAEEGHGFRQASSIKQAIEAELKFYQSIFF